MKNHAESKYLLNAESLFPLFVEINTFMVCLLLAERKPVHPPLLHPCHLLV